HHQDAALVRGVHDRRDLTARLRPDDQLHALARQLVEAGLGAVGILPGVDDVERHVRVLQLVVETLDRDLERGPARIAQRRPGAGDRQQRADPDLRLAGLRRRRQRIECKHGRERDDRAIGQRTAEGSQNAAFYTTAPLRHTWSLPGSGPASGGGFPPPTVSRTRLAFRPASAPAAALGPSRGTVRAQSILPSRRLRPPDPFDIAPFRTLRP